jgi:hypothetical protein
MDCTHFVDDTLMVLILDLGRKDNDDMNNMYTIMVLAR